MKTEIRSLFPQFSLIPEGAEWHPIPFTDALSVKVRKRLKTVTRRPLRVQPPAEFMDEDADIAPIVNGPHTRWAFSRIKGGNKKAWPPDPEPGFKCPYGRMGDVLWVREAHKFSTAHSCGENGCECEDVKITYRADGATALPPYPSDFEFGSVTRPAMFLPRWACRTILKVTHVDIERLQSITEHDAAAEGMLPQLRTEVDLLGETCRRQFMEIWQKIYGNWAKNPWVWRIQFELLEAL